MVVVEIAAHGALVALGVVEAVVAERESVRGNVDAVADGEGGIEYIDLHGRVAVDTAFHGEGLELAVEVYMTGGTARELRRDALHVIMDELEVGAVGIDLQVERAGGLDGVDEAVDTGTRDVGLTNAGIEVNALHVVVPFTVDVGIAQQAVVDAQVVDEEVGRHDGGAQHPTGVGRTVASPGN